MLGILSNGTKLEANARNSRNFILNHSVEEKTTRNSVLWNKNISKHLEFCSESFRRRDNNSEFRSEACLGRKRAVNSVCWGRIFCKTSFCHAISFRSVLRNKLLRKLRNASEWTLSSTEKRKLFRVYSAEFFRNEIPLPILAVTQRKDIYIEHWAGKAARLASWRKMTQLGEFCWWW
jgi:hypothetical protein